MGNNTHCGADRVVFINGQDVRGDHHAILPDKLAECRDGAFGENSFSGLRSMLSKYKVDTTGLVRVTLVDGSGKPVETPPELDFDSPVWKKIREQSVKRLREGGEPVDLKKILLGEDDGLGRSQLNAKDGNRNNDRSPEPDGKPKPDGDSPKDGNKPKGDQPEQDGKSNGDKSGGGDQSKDDNSEEGDKPKNDELSQQVLDKLNNRPEVKDAEEFQKKFADNPNSPEAIAWLQNKIKERTAEELKELQRRQENSGLVQEGSPGFSYGQMLLLNIAAANKKFNPGGVTWSYFQNGCIGDPSAGWHQMHGFFEDRK